MGWLLERPRGSLGGGVHFLWISAAKFWPPKMCKNAPQNTNFRKFGASRHTNKRKCAELCENVPKWLIYPQSVPFFKKIWCFALAKRGLIYGGFNANPKIWNETPKMLKLSIGANFCISTNRTFLRTLVHIAKKETLCPQPKWRVPRWTPSPRKLSQMSKQNLMSSRRSIFWMPQVNWIVPTKAPLDLLVKKIYILRTRHFCKFLSKPVEVTEWTRPAIKFWADSELFKTQTHLSTPRQSYTELLGRLQFCLQLLYYKNTILGNQCFIFLKLFKNRHHFAHSVFSFF